MVDLKESAAEANSLDSVPQAAAVDSIGADPGPAQISPEFTSGGNIVKFTFAQAFP